MSAPTRTCPACGTTNEGHYKFCLSCGGDMAGGSAGATGEPSGAAGVRRCPQCGRDNEAHYKFCLGCGVAIPDDLQPTAGVAPQGAALHDQFFAPVQAQSVTRGGNPGLLLALGAVVVLLLGAVIMLLML